MGLLQRSATALLACAPQAARLRGDYELQLGKPARAAKRGREGARLASEYGMPHEEALSSLRLGRQIGCGSDEAEPHLRRVQEILEDLPSQDRTFLSDP